MGLVEKWSALIASRTYTFAAATFAGIGIITAIVMGANAFSFDPVLLLDWFIAADPRVLDYETLLLGFLGIAESLNLTARSQPVEVFDCCAFQILYESPSEQMLTYDNLKDVCEFEKLFLRHPDYPLFCLTGEAEGKNTICVPEVNSLASQFYDFSNVTDCQELNETRYNELTGTILADTDSFFRGDDTALARSVLTLAGPLGADSTGGKSFGSPLIDQNDAQFVFYTDFFLDVEKTIFSRYGINPSPLFTSPYNSRSIAIGQDVNVRFLTRALYYVEILRLSDNDIAFVAFAIILVYVFSYVHVRSHFLCTVAIILIMQSLVVGIFFYKFILGISYFTTVSMLVLFLILGIGADGFYVITDAWVQSEELFMRTYGNVEVDRNNLLEVNKYGTGSEAAEITAARLDFTLRRASSSIFFTTITTVIAFIATATSPLIPMKAFGIFAAIVVFVNSVWVVTAYPVILVIFDAKLKDKSCCNGKDKDTESSGKAVVAGEDVDAKAIPTPSCESLVKVEESDDEHFEKQAVEDQDLGASPSAFARGYLWLLQRKTNGSLCGYKYTLYYVALLLSVASVVAAGFLCTYATLLSTPTEPDETLQTNHMFYSFGEDFRAVTKVGSSIDFSAVQLGVGFQGIDRGSFDEFSPNGFRGTPVYNPGFKPFTSSGQQFLLDLCSDLKDINCTDANGVKLEGCIRLQLVQEDTVVCVMTEFHNWYNMFQTPPVNGSLFTLGDADPDAVESLFLAFATGQVPNSTGTFLNQVGIVDGELRFIIIDCLLNLANIGPVGLARPVLGLLEEFIRTKNEIGSKDIVPVTLSAYELVWMVTQDVIVESLFRGLYICFPMAFAVLIFSTFNLLVAAIALATIVCISLSCLGFIQLLGWALGIGEVMLGIMIIGLSVDYVIHLGHMYGDARNSGKTARADKVAHSVTLMLDTVIAAWLTTTLSALVLLFAAANFFVKMAILISSAISFSLLYCVSFFLPMLMLIGPEGGFAQVPYLSCCKNEWGSRSSVDAKKANKEFVQELEEIQRQASQENDEQP